MNIFEVVKVYAKLIRENKNAYFLKFTVAHPYNNNRTRQYSKSTDGQEWNIWIPKNLSRKISNDYYLINDRLFTKLNNTNRNGCDFSKARLHFTISTFPQDVNVSYQALTLREASYSKHDNTLYRHNATHSRLNQHRNSTRGSLYRGNSRNEWLH